MSCLRQRRSISAATCRASAVPSFDNPDSYYGPNGLLFDVQLDPSETYSYTREYPEVVERLADGYEKWWESIMSEGPNERYAYIKVGSPKENPSRISSHDMLTGKFGMG